jgi:hypothetical protein
VKERRGEVALFLFLFLFLTRRWLYFIDKEIGE